MTNVPTQFTIPTIEMVPAHYIPMSHIKAASSAKTTRFNDRGYWNLIHSLRKGLVPSLRVNSTGKEKTPGGRAPTGRLFFDPKYATPRFMGPSQIAVVGDIIRLRDKHGLTMCCAGTPEYRRQINVVIKAFQDEYPALPVRQGDTVRNALKALPDKVVSPEVTEVDSLTARTNAPDELLAQLAGNSDATLCAIRENTAVMRQLLAVWTGVANVNP